MKVGDRVKIRRTNETWARGWAHKLGKVVEVRGDGDLLTVELGGIENIFHWAAPTRIRLCRDEVTAVGEDAATQARAFLDKKKND